MRSSVVCFMTALLLVQAAAAQSVNPDKDKVQTFFQEQQYDEAIDYLKPLVATDSTNMPALRYLGYAYYMNDNTKAAKQCYLTMFRNDSVNITANHYLAAIYYNRDPDLSLEYFLRLNRLQPKNANYMRSIGELLSRSKQKDTALVWLNQAYDIAPGDKKNLQSLADVLIDVKDFKKADSLLEIGLMQDSMDASFLRSRIRSAYEAKDYNCVLLPGERLMRQEDITLSTFSKVVLAYYNLKLYTDCIRVCAYLRKMEMQAEALDYYEAKAWAKLKDFDRSNTLLQSCLNKAISKNAEMYYFDLGQNHESTREWKQAVAAYDTAYYMFQSPLALYNCGRIYEAELDNETLARRYYLRYLAVAKPEAEDEKRAYAYVKKRYGGKQSGVNRRESVAGYGKKTDTASTILPAH